MKNLGYSAANQIGWSEKSPKAKFILLLFGGFSSPLGQFHGAIIIA